MAPKQTGAQPAVVRARSLEPTRTYFAATPSDDTDEAQESTGGVFVGGAGNLTLVRDDDTAVTFSGVPAGAYLPVVAKRVNAASLTASGIVFLVAGA